ncbi:hypothetical protein ACQ4PT_014307 [Festuca glaucescens]
MGCTTSHDAFAAAASRARRRATGHTHASSSSASRRARDPAAVCRERAALIRAAADRRFALAAAHAAYFRSLAAVGGALRRFAAAALLPADDHASPVLTLPPSPAKPVATASTLPPSPSGSSSTVSPLSHSLSDSSSDDEDLHALDHSRRFRPRNAPPPQPARQQHRHYMRNSATAPNVVYADPYAEYAEAQTGYGAYPYGPYGEVVPGDRRPPPTPPPPEPTASAWDFFDPFTPYDQFLEDYSRGNGGGISWNLPASSPNYAEVRRMEGIPELEDEAELEAKAAAASKPSTTSAVADENVKGKRPVPATNAGSKGECSDVKLQSKRSSSPNPKGRPSEVKKGPSGANGERSEVRLQSKRSSGPKGGSSEVKMQSKGPSGANGDAEKPVSARGNASWKSKKGGSSDTASLKGMGSSDIDGGSSTAKKKGVAFDKDVSTVDAYGEGGSHGKPAHPAMTVSSESFSPLHSGDRDVMEAMEEIKGRFEEAADCGDDVSKLLEVGKVPHRATPKVLRYFSSTVSSSHCLPKRQRNSRLPSTASSTNGRRDPDLNLSSTLEKLCLWEKKLYQEVKDEEKLRIVYEKKYKRLKLLDERGAQPEAIDPIRLSVQDLRQRISINIRTAKAFSSKIEKIRDEELYPQLVNLIQGLRRMWKAVLECHERQLSAMRDSRIHLLKARTISESSAAARATLELERELSKWYRCFNKWISTQRAYVEALNGWLRKWFPEVQEEQDAPDGVPPFSPGKLGARPIFVISNDWFQAIELVPKNDTLKSIDYFSKLVHEFRRSQEDEHRQRRRADHASRDYKRKREVLQRELGVSSSTDMVAVTEHAPPGHDDRVIELQKLRKRRDDERARHNEVMKHAHFAAAATLPVGFVPLLEQMVSFFQGNQQVYMRIRINAAHLGSSATHLG